MQYGRNIFRLWDCDCFFLKIHTAMLWTKEALPILAGFEAWKADRLGITEKVGVGGIEIAQSALQGL